MRPIPTLCTVHATQRPTFRLYGDGRVGDGSPEKVQPSVTPANTIDKTPLVAQKSSARKVPLVLVSFKVKFLQN